MNEPMLEQPQGDECDAGPRSSAPGTQRLCAATGEVKLIDEMVRFVLSPEGAAVPDVRRRLPGRGVWITATRHGLSVALARKAFARSFKREVSVPPGLVEMTEHLFERGALDALAIAHKARKVAIGFAKTEVALRRDRVAALIHAADAAPDGIRKLDAAVRHRLEGGDKAKTIVIIASLSGAQLDLALGRSNVIHAALLAGPESETFLARVRRLERFRAGGPGDRGARPGPKRVLVLG
jgi:predicted RNA-binding protein YlxR (DUF448 family)